MYLVDTSVWIDYLNGKDTKTTDFLETLMSTPAAIGLNAQIYMEVLQGARSQSSFNKLQAYFSTQQLYVFADELDAAESAAQLYIQARQRGITIRSSLDCLIAHSAITHNLVLLHQDKDFLNVGKVLPTFKQKHFFEK
jgi:predicted nucleic acid-binding protein